MNNTFKRLLNISSDYKFWMIIASFVGFLTIGSSIGLMMTSAYIIAKAALHPSISELQIGIVGVRFFGITRGVFRYIERYISHEITFKLLAKFRVWFFESIQPLFPSKISKYKSGDLLTRAVNDVENLEHIYVRVIAPPLVALFILLLITYLFGSFSLIYGVIIIVYFLLAGIGIPVLTFLLSKKIGSRLVALQLRMNELILDQTQGLSELLVFNQKKNFAEEYNKTQKEYFSLQRKNAQISGLHEALIGLLMNFAVITILIATIPNVSNGILDGVYLSVLALGTMASFEALLPLPTALQFWEHSIKSANRLFEITDIEQNKIEKQQKTIKINSFSIKFDSVNFGYSKDEPIYKNLSFIIPENKLTAIVGASGAGKSTLINILFRFWEYNSGKIFLGDTKLENIAKDNINELISVVPQTTHLFNLSIKENIRFANLTATDEDIYTAAKKANIHEFVLSLPYGYNELVGEQGLKLSGGERQRIAIARALLKNSPIFLLDEPTTGLDSISEEQIINLLYKLSMSHTVLLITHRLTHLEKAEKILVMNKGEIIETGKHDELLHKRGYYFKMYNLENDLVV